MGLLNEGSPLSHEETMKYAQHVREHGIIQYINAYKKNKDRQGDVLKWGDEIEYTIVKYFEDKKIAKVNLRCHELLSVLNEKERTRPEEIKGLWRPEYAAYMIEGTPPKPFGDLPTFNTVEANMKSRREEIKEYLKPDEAILCVTSFPRLGCEDFTYPPTKVTTDRGITRSLFYPDEAINQVHPRWKNATNNIRERRGEKVAINLPIFRDENTKIPVDDSFKTDKNAVPDCVYLDCMGFGGGYCCLQATVQGSDINQAKHLYDQLTPFCPIMIALAASAPIHRGFLTDVDARWDVICHTSDCRTAEERGLVPLKKNKFVLKKSRYGSIDSYLSPPGEKYNDIPLTYYEEDYKKLVDNGIDHLLAGHIAHLFVRDTISLFSEKIHQNDEEETDHFENIQSTNWQSMRFKLPPPNTDIGWRVEFRPCDVQITYFENAAYVCFIALLTRIVLHYNLNFLMPMSKVDENIAVSQKRDAVNKAKFWFRQDIGELNGVLGSDKSTVKGTDVFALMSTNEIMNGKKGEFPGIIPLMRSYLKSQEIDSDTQYTLEKYLRLIEDRANGKLMTGAAWLRKYVTEHPEYRKDSKVTERINYDLLKTIEAIQDGKISCPELLGADPRTKTKESIQ
ncbi:glutamate--cysteine ligase [Leptinotarsa decemlineata]|uniref:glutamate--cysteine ligase n=1 Tax=Leptinotarsa decemlineata TaxID=7539 RepID=UPI003D308A2F